MNIQWAHNHFLEITLEVNKQLSPKWHSIPYIGALRLTRTYKGSG